MNVPLVVVTYAISPPVGVKAEAAAAVMPPCFKTAFLYKTRALDLLLSAVPFPILIISSVETNRPTFWPVAVTLKVPNTSELKELAVLPTPKQVDEYPVAKLVVAPIELAAPPQAVALSALAVLYDPQAVAR